MRNGNKRSSSTSSSASSETLPSFTEVRGRVEELRDRLMEQASEHPLRTAAYAIGAGFLLGGGLFSGLSARLLGTGLRVGLRVAFIPFVTRGLAAWGETLFQNNQNNVSGSEPADAPVAQPFGSSSSQSPGSKKQLRQQDPKENNP